MTSEVFIDVQPQKIAIALTEDKRLVEYQEEQQSASFSVGNVYVARVRKLMPGLNACFVNVGHERDAFLHYLDLGIHYNSFAKYLKQVMSDKKNFYSPNKASIQPALGKDGSVQDIVTSHACLDSKPDGGVRLASTGIAVHDNILAFTDEVKRLQFRQGNCHILWQFTPVKVFKILELGEVSLGYERPNMGLFLVLNLPAKQFCKEAVVRPLLCDGILQQYAQTAFDTPELEYPAVIVYRL